MNRAPFPLPTAVVLLIIAIVGARAEGTLKVANIFSEGMVLQQERPITIWGWDAAGSRLSVTFAGEKRTVLVDPKGAWSATFPARKASFDRHELKVESGQTSKTMKDILIGEVWLCGGQSNMAPARHDQADVEFPSADSEFVRYTRVEGAIAPKPASDLMARDGWKALVAGKMEIRRISPVSYYFGIRLQRFLKVPVGIINTAVGGTTAEVWASRKTQAGNPQLRDLVQAGGKDIGAFFNGTIAPLSRLPLRGALFYQGENNTFEGYETYRHSFPNIIIDWRANFAQPDLPFGIISLAGNKGMNAQPDPEGEMNHRHSYTHIRDVHFRTHRSLPYTGLITIHDLGADDMHPPRKRDVGERAARWALAQVYGYAKKPVGKGGIYHMAPLYREMKIAEDKIQLFFDYDPTIDDVRAGKTYKRLPIMDRAREFRGFLIAGKDRRFYPTQVKIRAVKDGEDIRGEHLEVWSEFVPKPVAVRYAWENQPNANAYGLHGLPVAPFRTDDWPFIRALPKWASDLEERERANEERIKQHNEWRRLRRIAEARRGPQSLAGTRCGRGVEHYLVTWVGVSPPKPPTSDGRSTELPLGQRVDKTPITLISIEKLRLYPKPYEKSCLRAPPGHPYSALGRSRARSRGPLPRQTDVVEVCPRCLEGPQGSRI